MRICNLVAWLGVHFSRRNSETTRYEFCMFKEVIQKIQAKNLIKMYKVQNVLGNKPKLFGD